MDLSIILSLFVSLAQKYPVLASVIAVMGTARLVMKPIVSCIKALVELTPSKSDDEKVAQVEASKPYKAVIFVLDYFLSVKPIKK
jgi:hypothetical protein